MQSLRALFCKYVIPLGIALSGGANVCVRLLAGWFLRSAALPRITEARIRVDPFDLPSFRWFRGSLIAVNNGRRKCLVTYLRVRDEKLGFQINNVAEQSEMDMTLWIKGRIKSLLPSPVEAGESITLFFGGLHEVETLDELPESLSLEVSFDCRQEPLRCTLTRNS
ncbi:MAG: hypothetical protein ABIF19_07215, partial [Planctomycetota bacterium]